MNIREELRKTPVQLGVLAVLLLIFIALELSGAESLGLLKLAAGLLFVAAFFGFVLMEVKGGAKKHGWKHEVIDTAIALGIALGVWFGAQFILNTPVPISAVVSCSMLDSLYRGDFVIVQGAPVTAYDIEITETELAELQAGYATVTHNGAQKKVKGSAYSFCKTYYFEDFCNNFTKRPSEYHETIGPFTYHYENCLVAMKDGTNTTEQCLTAVEFQGKKYLTNMSHDTIVYGSDSDSLFSLFGDIVHRAFFRMSVNGEHYYITRGDNNPVLDTMMYSYAYRMGNPPVPEKNNKGRVIGRIPVLGYVKLLISGQMAEPEQCRTQLIYGHA